MTGGVGSLSLRFIVSSAIVILQSIGVRVDLSDDAVLRAASAAASAARQCPMRDSFCFIFFFSSSFFAYVSPYVGGRC